MFVGALTENSMRKNHTGVSERFAAQGNIYTPFDILQFYYKEIVLIFRHPKTRKGWEKQKYFAKG